MEISKFFIPLHHQTKETTKIIGDKTMIEVLEKLDSITLEELQNNIERIFEEVEDKAVKIYTYASSLGMFIHIDKSGEKVNKVLKEYPILKHLVSTRDTTLIAKGAEYIAIALKNWRVNMLKENHNFRGVSISRQFREYRRVRFTIEAQGNVLSMFYTLGIYPNQDSREVLSNGDIVFTYSEEAFKEIMDILSITTPLTEKFIEIVNMDMIRKTYKSYSRESIKNLDTLVCKIMIENAEAFKPLHVYCPFNSFLCKDRLKEISEKNVEQLLKRI